jgi:hypothetical protein
MYDCFFFLNDMAVLLLLIFLKKQSYLSRLYCLAFQFRLEVKFSIACLFTAPLCIDLAHARAQLRFTLKCLRLGGRKTHAVSDNFVMAVLKA